MSIYASCQPRRVQPAGVFVLWLAWRSSTLVRTEFLKEALALQRGVAVNPGKTEAKADAKTETK